MVAGAAVEGAALRFGTAESQDESRCSAIHKRRPYGPDFTSKPARKEPGNAGATDAGGASLRVLIGVVDLGALQAVGVVDVKRLPIGVKIRAAWPASRWPLPVFLIPPKGRCVSAPMVGAFT